MTSCGGAHLTYGSGGCPYCEIERLSAARDTVAKLSAEIHALLCPDNPGGAHRWNGDGQCLDCCNYATDLIEKLAKQEQDSEHT